MPVLTLWASSCSPPRACSMNTVFFLYRVVWPWPMTPPQLFRMGKGALWNCATRKWQRPVQALGCFILVFKEQLVGSGCVCQWGPYLVVSCGSLLMRFLPPGFTRLLITSPPAGCLLSLRSPRIFHLLCLLIRYVRAQKGVWGFSLSLCFR